MCLNWLDLVHQEYHVLILFMIQIPIYPCIVDSPPSWSLLFSFLKKDHLPPAGKFLASKLQMAKDPIVISLASLIMLFCSSGRGWRALVCAPQVSTSLSNYSIWIWFYICIWFGFHGLGILSGRNQTYFAWRAILWCYDCIYSFLGGTLEQDRLDVYRLFSLWNHSVCACCWSVRT